jgi:hypothetical protein
MNEQPRIAMVVAIGVLLVAVMIGIFGRKPGRGDAQVAHRKPVVASYAEAGTVSAAPSSRSTTAVATAARPRRRGVYDPGAKQKPTVKQADWVCIPGSGVGLWPKKAT